jgi:predicted dienelactone hydrolase
VVSFPRPGEAVNVAVAGPYTTANYDNGVQNAEYGDATVYYPTNASAPFAAVALCPGYLQTKDDLVWLAQMLASHGIVALTLTPEDNFAGAAPRAVDLTAALNELRGENTRAGGPLLGKLDLTRLGVLGHGYGGAAALSVANSQGTQLRAVVPLASWDTASYPNVKAAALFVAAEDDVFAPVASNAFAHYGSIPAPIKKVFAELDNAGHFVSVGNPSNALKGLQTRHVLSFLKIYLEDDTRYQTYVYGLEHGKDAASFSRYLTAP